MVQGEETGDSEEAATACCQCPVYMEDSYTKFKVSIHIRDSNKGYPKVFENFTITEKAPTRAFSWLEAPTSVFTFKTLLGNLA